MHYLWAKKRGGEGEKTASALNTVYSWLEEVSKGGNITFCQDGKDCYWNGDRLSGIDENVYILHKIS